MADEKQNKDEGQVFLVTGGAVTAHRSLGSEVVDGNEFHHVESVVLDVGDSIPVADVPPYEAENLRALNGVEEVSEEEAARVRLERARALGTVPVEAQPGESLIPVDNSHSDWIVPDEERAANLDDQGKAEAAKTKAAAPPKGEAAA